MVIIVSMLDIITAKKERELIKQLTEAQKHKNMSDYSFAKLLKVPRSTWYVTKTGKKPIGMTMLRAISQTFPELDCLIIQFLKEDHNGH